MTFSINPTANKTQAMFEQMAIAQNGTGTVAAIAGGSSTTLVSTAAVATSTSSSYSGSSGSDSSSSSSGSSSSGSIVSGTGSMVGGQCECSCLCGVAEFPSALQGIAGFGGMSGR